MFVHLSTFSSAASRGVGIAGFISSTQLFVRVLIIVRHDHFIEISHLCRKNAYGSAWESMKGIPCMLDAASKIREEPNDSPPLVEKSGLKISELSFLLRCLFEGVAGKNKLCRARPKERPRQPAPSPNSSVKRAAIARERGRLVIWV